MLEILVQTATGTSSLASTPVTFPNNTTNGNSIIVAVGNSSATSGDVSGITDTQGNVYSKAFTTSNASVGDLELWYTSNIKGGANTITVAYTTGVSCAVIVREYYGTAYPITILDQQTSTTGNSNALSSGATGNLKQYYELAIGAGLIPLADTFSVGVGWNNLTTLSAPTVVQVAMEDQLITVGGTVTATFGANTGLQWVCGVGTFLLAPTGTTTSTSFTTSTSVSSTSASSTSTSASSTSASSSTSSTSTSLSSTSSSISSTSSSTSSTSLSSTSSSTSLSSTSSSISSTSISSTSLSSTSSSSSISSTSSSFSSTSSSISSTSSSVSSTSLSSTSSSSSTSTTTLPPPYQTYSYQDINSIPSTNSNLTNNFTVVAYGNVSTDDGDYFIERGSRYMIREYKSQHNNNTDNITMTWKGRSTISTLVSPILIQIYNINSSTWETLCRQTQVPADTDFSVTVSQTTNVSNYYDTTNTVAFRSYQQVM